MTRMRHAPESPPLVPSAPLGVPTAPRQPESDLSAKEAAARTSAKQEEFVALVVKPHSPMLRARARMLLSPDKVEDLVQDVLLKAWRYDVVVLCGGDARGIRTYLKEALANCVKDLYRSEGRRRDRDARYAASDPPSSSDEEGPLDYAILGDIDGFVNRTLQKSPRRCVNAFEKVHLERMPLPKAAEALHMSLGTLKVHLRTFNRMLRRDLPAVDYYSPPVADGEEKEDTP